MQITEERERDWQVVQAMKHYGGSFVHSLSKLWFLADEENRKKIKEAWPEYWVSYSETARIMREKNGDKWWDR